MDSLNFSLNQLESLLTQAIAVASRLDVLAGVIGVAGALLVARYDRLSWVGWVLWIVSNTMWLKYGLSHDVAGILIQNSVYLVTAVKGLRRCVASGVGMQGGECSPAKQVRSLWLRLQGKPVAVPTGL